MLFNYSKEKVINIVLENKYLKNKINLWIEDFVVNSKVGGESKIYTVEIDEHNYFEIEYIRRTETLVKEHIKFCSKNNPQIILFAFHLVLGTYNRKELVNIRVESKQENEPYFYISCYTIGDITYYEGGKKSIRKYQTDETYSLSYILNNISLSHSEINENLSISYDLDLNKSSFFNNIYFIIKDLKVFFDYN